MESIKIPPFRGNTAGEDAEEFLEYVEFAAENWTTDKSNTELLRKNSILIFRHHLDPEGDARHWWKNIVTPADKTNFETVKKLFLERYGAGGSTQAQVQAQVQAQAQAQVQAQELAKARERVRIAEIKTAKMEAEMAKAETRAAKADADARVAKAELSGFRKALGKRTHPLIHQQFPSFRLTGISNFLDKRDEEDAEEEPSSKKAALEEMSVIESTHKSQIRLLTEVLTVFTTQS
jgi:hypothetical protein